MGFDLTIKLSKEDLERLEAIKEAINKNEHSRGVRRNETIAGHSLQLGMAELERIFDIKRPKKIEPRDSYEQHDQLCLRLSF